MEELKVTTEQAKAELEKWLFDVKKIRPSKIERKKELVEAVETVTDAIANGIVSIDEKGNLTQILVSSPETTVTELKFKPRWTGMEMDRMNRAKDDAAKSREMICILTGQHTAVINKLDPTNDLSLASVICMFYYLP